MATHTTPGAWIDEDPKLVATVLDVMARQAREAAKGG